MVNQVALSLFTSRHWILLLLLLGHCCCCDATEWLITGIIDGPLPGGLPKAIEVCACGQGPLENDNSTYSLSLAPNGQQDGPTFVFPDTTAVQSGQCVTVATEATAFSAFFGGAHPTYTDTVANMNGNDAVELLRNGERVDVFGQVGVNGDGTAWNYQDGWAYRVAETEASTRFVSDDWVFSVPNALDNVATRPFPLGSFQCTNPPVPRKINEIQGPGYVSPLVDEKVVVSGIVVGDFQAGDADVRNLYGFFIQSLSGDEDSDDRTSEGLYVVDGGFPEVDINLGDIVEVTGEVKELFDMTAIVSTSVLIVSSGNSVPNPTRVGYGENRGGVDSLEPFEGMYVSLRGHFVIVKQFNLDRFGQVTLQRGRGLPKQFTQQHLPDVTAYENYQRDIASKRIVYDDGRSSQNQEISDLDGFGNYSTSSAPRMGDMIRDPTGILSYSFGEFRLNSIEEGENRVESKRNPRPATVPDVGGSHTIAVFNVLNFFSTLGSRGADNAKELTRQTQKLVTTLVELDADVLALIEIENNFSPKSALQVLVDELLAFDQSYEFVYPGVDKIGSDEIAVALLYKTETIQESGNAAVLVYDEAVAKTRPSFAQTFSPRSTNAPTRSCFTVAVNHFKSKGSTCAALGDPDRGDGQGNCNGVRVAAASRLVEWLDTKPTSDCDNVVVMGDLNAYRKEDPIALLEQNGYRNVLNSRQVTYVFDGLFGTLDYVLPNSAFRRNLMSGASVWNINSLEGT